MFRSILLAALLLAPAAAPAKWHEASSAHFLIYSDEKPETLRQFAEKLEKFDAAMRLMHRVEEDISPTATRLTIHVVPSTSSVRQLFGTGGNGVAGFYTPRSEGSIAFMPRRAGSGERYDLNAETILLHEYAHHFMMRNFSEAFPAWYIEGFAEFNSTTKFEADGSVGVGTAPLHRAYGLFFGRSLTIEKVLQTSVGELRDAAKDELYGRGWLLTHYLTFEPSRSGQMITYLRALNSGKSSLDAARSAFGDLKKLEKELTRYLERPKLSYATIPAARIKVGPIAVRPLSPGEEATMEVRIRSDRGVNREQAIALISQARKAAARHVGDPVAQTVLAEAEYDAGNYAEAEAAADRAIAANPRLIDALMYKGRAKAALALASGSSDPESWKEVRKWFVSANKIDPDDPEPLLLFYQSFLLQGERPNANAAMGLFRALELAPEGQNGRWVAVRRYLEDGEAAEARTALKPLAYDPHGGPFSELATALIAAIDGGGAKSALELLHSRDAEAAGST